MLEPCGSSECQITRSPALAEMRLTGYLVASSGSLRTSGTVIFPVAQPADNAGNLSPAQLRRMRSPFNVFQLDATAYPGNSGSPVYRESDGQVIGVLNSVFVKGSRESALQNPSGISYAIPATWLKALLDTISVAEN